MPPEPARPHPGPWRIEHPEHLTAPLLRAADGAELYYLERVSATVADDALVAAAPALRAALERFCQTDWYDPEYERCWYCQASNADAPAEDVIHADECALLQGLDALAATAPAAPGEPHA